MKRLLSILWHDVYARDASESGFAGPGAERYKLPATEFDAQLEALARVRKEPPILVTELANDAADRVPLTLTVDDGGLSYYTTVAERLESRGWRGHCFITTGCIGRPGFLDATQICELHQRGHIIGTHSVSHPERFASCSWKQLLREWTESRTTLEDILGERVIAGSVPGGYFSARVAEAARKAGLEVLFTSEPETRLQAMDCLTIAGRYTVRRGRGADFTRSLGGLEPTTLFREWAVWNTKKLAKVFLGAAYPRIGLLASRVNQSSFEYVINPFCEERAEPRQRNTTSSRGFIQ